VEQGVTTHLYRREGGTYYFRRAIPVALRSQFDGKREWIKSLATKDRGEAKRLLPSLVVAFDEAMDGEPQTRLAEGVAAATKTRLTIPTARAEKPRACVSVPLIGTFEAYAVEQGIKASTASEWRSMLTALIAFIGHDDAAALTVHDIDRWRDALLSETGPNGLRRSPGTVKGKYLCALRATLAWAVEKRLLSRNVAHSVKVRVPKKAKLRDRDFSQDEAQKILAATYSDFTSCNVHERLARRWIPWLCAYTGARVNEISQLRGIDVKQIGGIWTLHITPDAGTVKNGETRQVPIHAHLIEQGFIQVAQSAGSMPMFYDVSRITRPGIANRYYKKVGERLRDWIRLEVGLVDPNVQPNHGWRHTFKTRAIDAGIAERVADAIQGHAPRSVGQAYGTVSLGAKRDAIEAMPRFILAAKQDGR
jgi:integrase